MLLIILFPCLIIFGVFLILYSKKTVEIGVWFILIPIFVLIIASVVQLQTVYKASIEIPALYAEADSFCSSIDDIKNVMSNAEPLPNVVIGGSLENLNQRQEATKAAVHCATLKSKYNQTLKHYQQHEKSTIAFLFMSGWMFTKDIHNQPVFE